MMTAKGLAKLLEELGELSQVAAKKLAFMHTDEHPDGAGSLKVRMENEMADVSAAMLFVQEKLDLNAQAIHDRTYAKLGLLLTWDDLLEVSE